MISIVDYGVGNLQSLKNAFSFLNIRSKLIRTAAEIVDAEKLVLPGVGAFAYAMQNIQELELHHVLVEKVGKGCPVLGICLGMQILFTSSEEGGQHLGLDLIPGRVKVFQTELKVPHMGWNEIKPVKSSGILQSLPATRYGYFVHSLYCVPDAGEAVIATTEYGETFASAVAKDNIYGVQFHPEKSQELGLQILKNFSEL